MDFPSGKKEGNSARPLRVTWRAADPSKLLIHTSRGPERSLIYAIFESVGETAMSSISRPRERWRTTFAGSVLLVGAGSSQRYGVPPSHDVKMIRPSLVQF